MRLKVAQSFSLSSCMLMDNSVFILTCLFFTLNPEQAYLIYSSMSSLYWIGCPSHRHVYSRHSKYEINPMDHASANVIKVCQHEWLQIHALTLTSCFYEKTDVLFVKIPQTISRTTGPNIGLFILNLMHFSYWFQIWSQLLRIQNFFFKISWKKNKKLTVSPAFDHGVKRASGNM